MRQRKRIWLVSLGWAASACFAGELSKFCFEEHPAGYYAIVLQSATDSTKIDRQKVSSVLSTDGLSGVKNGLYIGTAGIYLSKQEAEKQLRKVRKTTPDAYVKNLGAYSNESSPKPIESCPNCWSFRSGEKAIQGRFVAGKGWELQLPAARTHLLAAGREPIEDHLCLHPVSGAGWLIAQEFPEGDCCSTRLFKILSAEGKVTDEKKLFIDDGPEYIEVQVLSGPEIVRKKNGAIDGAWGVVNERFEERR